MSANVALPPAQSADLAAAEAAACARLSADGIGRLNERTLHSTLKYWLEPDDSRHEVPVGSHVADIFDGDQVIEVQTGGLYPLADKVADLLDRVPVTVVVPLIRKKWLCWIDPATGERGAFHRSPKTGRAAELLPELYWLRELLPPCGRPCPLTVRVLLLDVEEYRVQDGWSRDGKRGSHRADRRPLAVAGEVYIRSRDDLAGLLPALPEPFTAKEFARALGHRGMALSRALRLLEATDVIFRAGKRGNAILYSLQKPTP